LSPVEFKALFRKRGWTGKTLALRWEVSEAWISKILKIRIEHPIGMMLYAAFQTQKN
jgi:hypothetical protein